MNSMLALLHVQNFQCNALVCFLVFSDVSSDVSPQSNISFTASGRR